MAEYCPVPQQCLLSSKQKKLAHPGQLDKNWQTEQKLLQRYMVMIYLIYAIIFKTFSQQGAYRNLF